MSDIKVKYCKPICTNCYSNFENLKPYDSCHSCHYYDEIDGDYFGDYKCRFCDWSDEIVWITSTKKFYFEESQYTYGDDVLKIGNKDLTGYIINYLEVDGDVIIPKKEQKNDN